MVSSSMNSLRDSESRRSRLASSRVRKTEYRACRGSTVREVQELRKSREAAGLFREEDFRDVEHRINPGDLMDLLADQVNGVRIRTDGDTHSFLRIRFLGTWWSSATIVLISSARCLKGRRSRSSPPRRSPPCLGPRSRSSRRTRCTTESLRLLLLLVAGGTCPRGSRARSWTEGCSMDRFLNRSRSAV